MSETSLTSEVAALYDERAGEYDARYQRNTDHAEDRVLYGWLADLARDKNVLDVGCGTGAALDHLQPRSYLGVDVSRSMLGCAAHRVSLDFELGSLQSHASGALVTDTAPCHRGWFDDKRKATITLAHHDICGPRSMERCFFQIGSGHFDLAMSLWAFPHFDDQQRAIDEMAAAVRPGGWVVVQGFSERYAKRPNYILNGHAADVLKPTTPTGLRLMMLRAGLEDRMTVGFRYLMDPPGLHHLPTGLLERAFRLSSATLPAHWASTHLVFARKPKGAKRGGRV